MPAKMISAILLAAAIMLSLAGAPTGHADSIDDQFISALSSQGITVDRDLAISQAHKLCDVFRRIQDNQDRIAVLQWVGLHNAIRGQGLSEAQYRQSADAGSSTYCPGHGKDKLK